MQTTRTRISDRCRRRQDPPGRALRTGFYITLDERGPIVRTFAPDALELARLLPLARRLEVLLRAARWAS